MSGQVTPVILCGGSGTRLWPLSRASLPKQLLALVGERSLLQQTWLRTREAGSGDARPIVVCNEQHRFLVEAQLRAIGADPVLILEPEGRNTAPAAAMAAMLAARVSGDETPLLVLPSDHVVAEPARFTASVAAGLPAARAGDLVAFGVVPYRPETGYGYIHADKGEGNCPRRVISFVEKPDLAAAREYVAAGDHFWNSGMFLFTAGAFLRELEAHAPDIRQGCDIAMAGAAVGRDVVCPDRRAFLTVRSISIDYAVMERTSRASVVPLDAGWSDVGSWSALLDSSDRDPSGNAIIGDVMALDCHGSYLRSESRLVAAIGLDGCVVVETKDAILVAPRASSQDIKCLVDSLAARRRPEVASGREVFRPWGSYDSLETRPGFQVKRLAVLPGAVLSLQLHHRRAEHWIVVSGQARITRGDEVFDLYRNEHAYIPLGERHRIENPGSELLEIIEVQIGDYLGEDDIVRLEDRYGRQGRTD